MRFGKNTVILEKGSRPNEICLIMSGTVLNESTGRFFTDGTMFGEEDLILRRERRDTFRAETEVYIFKYDRKVIENMMKQHPEVGEEIRTLASNRDKMRNNQDSIKSMIH